MNNFRPWGGSYFDRYSGMFPPAIKWLLIANAFMFLMPRVLLTDLDLFHRYLGLVPAYVWGKGYIWQLVTYMFLHGGLWHILMNMFILWMFGSELERTWGSREFLKFYFIAGIGAGIINVAFAAFRPDMAMIPIIGASGAIYGLLVAYAMLFPERYVYVYFMIPVKVKYLVIFMVALEFFSTYQPDGVAHFAHLGGAAVGFLFLLADTNLIPVRSWWNSLRKPKMVENEPRWNRPPDEVQDAKFYDISSGRRLHDEHEINQAVIDAILDKIGKGGYQSLTEEEKRILNEASRKIH